MSLRKYSAATLFLLVSLWSVGASQQENGINAIKIADGYFLVWNQPDIHFTLEVKGKEVRPLNSTEHVFFNVDGIIFQVQSVAISEFLKDAEKQKLSDQAILTAHRDWEAQFIQSSLLDKKLNVQSATQRLGDGTEALLWRFDMPDMPHSVRSDARAQIYLTMVKGAHVVLLNGVVRGTVAESEVRKFLLNTSTTLKTSPGPINARELQETIRKRNGQ